MPGLEEIRGFQGSNYEQRPSDWPRIDWAAAYAQVIGELCDPIGTHADRQAARSSVSV